MMRLTVIGVCILLGLAGPIVVTSAQVSAPAARCRAEAAALSAAGAVQTRSLPYFVEVELTLLNKSQGWLRLDPSRFVLQPDRGDLVASASPQQVVYTLSNPGSNVGIYGGFWTGWVGVAIGAYPLNPSAWTINNRILKPGELAPGATIKGSVFFAPSSWPTSFTVLLDGLAGGSGAGLPSVELQNCQMPFRPSQPPVVFGPPPPGARTFAVTARADAGPIAVSVSSVAFNRLATTLTVTVENSAEVDADLFVAIGETRLIDNTGKAYIVRMLPSDLPDHVGPRSQSRGHLVFEPLPIPPEVTAVQLTMPGVRLAAATYDITIDLRF